MTDDEFAALDQTSRDFAVRWISMSEDDQDRFCHQLLVVMDVLQRLGTFDPPPAGEDLAPA